MTMRAPTAILVSMGLAACGAASPQPAPCPAAPKPSAVASAPAAPNAPAPAALTRPEVHQAQPPGVSTLPGCTPAERTRAYQRLEAIRVKRRPRDDEKDSTDDKAGELATLIGELWASPCLAHVRRFYDLPPLVTIGDVNAFFSQFGEALAIGGLLQHGTTRFYVLPAEPARELDVTERRRLAPWTCPSAKDPACVAAKSYIERAHQDWDRTEWDERRQSDLEREREGAHAKSCADPDPEQKTMTRFERWVTCAAALAPRTHRYAKNVALRAPERGWLVLRGRRGHYSFSDEVRAYDLATGAAYVAASGSALVLDGPQPGVDHKQTEKNRAARVYAGRVSRDHLRELAFALVTAPAVVRERAYRHDLVVPEGLPLEIGSGPRPTVDHSFREWRTSNHTTLQWTLAEGATVVAKGTLYYPSSPRAAEDHADELLHSMEAGLVEGCTPSRLPADIPLGGKVRVSSIDADAGTVDAVMSKLETALVALRPVPCR